MNNIHKTTLATIVVSAFASLTYAQETGYRIVGPTRLEQGMVGNYKLVDNEGRLAYPTKEGKGDCGWQWDYNSGLDKLLVEDTDDLECTISFRSKAPRKIGFYNKWIDEGIGRDQPFVVEVVPKEQQQKIDISDQKTKKERPQHKKAETMKKENKKPKPEVSAVETTVPQPSTPPPRPEPRVRKWNTSFFDGNVYRGYKIEAVEHVMADGIRMYYLTINQDQIGRCERFIRWMYARISPSNDVQGFEQSTLIMIGGTMSGMVPARQTDLYPENTQTCKITPGYSQQNIEHIAYDTDCNMARSTVEKLYPDWNSNAILAAPLFTIPNRRYHYFSGIPNPKEGVSRYTHSLQLFLKLKVPYEDKTDPYIQIVFDTDQDCMSYSPSQITYNIEFVGDKVSYVQRQCLWPPRVCDPEGVSILEGQRFICPTSPPPSRACLDR